MKELADNLTALIFIAWWLAGIAIAKGFWFTVLSLFPPYAMYLVVEKIVNHLL